MTGGAEDPDRGRRGRFTPGRLPGRARSPNRRVLFAEVAPVGLAAADPRLLAGAVVTVAALSRNVLLTISIGFAVFLACGQEGVGAGTGRARGG